MNSKTFILITTIFYSLLTITATNKKVNSYVLNNQNNLDLNSIFLENFILVDNYLQGLAEKLANNYLNKILTPEINQDLTLKQAQQIQNQFVEILSSKLGKKIGYKAGLTNKIAQEKFGINHPLSGVLLEKMILDNGAIIPDNFGAKTMLEGDLMVRVKSEAINQAKTPEETLKYLDAVIPFVELPDLVYDNQVQLTASKLVAINVGARLGVKGKAITIDSSQEWQDKLANIEIVIKDENNQLLATGNSSNLLGNPLEVVFWLKNNLNDQGILLKQGDLLSLGTITPMIPLKPNTVITAEYSGVSPNPVQVKMTFSN